MEATQTTIQGRLIGASEVKDFTSGLSTGQTQLTIGARTPEGRLVKLIAKLIQLMYRTLHLYLMRK